MVPTILEFLDTEELRLALALCLVYPGKNAGTVVKGMVNLPDEMYRQLCRCRLPDDTPVVGTNGSKRYRVAASLRRLVSEEIRTELIAYVNQPHFVEQREAWKKSYEDELAAHKKMLNTSFSSANKAQPLAHRDGPERIHTRGWYSI